MQPQFASYSPSTPMNAAELTAELKQEATRLGFDLVGATTAVPSPDLGYFRQWLDAGRCGAMHYLSTRFEAYRHPSGILDGARSLLMLGTNYRSVEPEGVHSLSKKMGQSPLSKWASPISGQISRFAWGDDYHAVIRERLRQLTALHRRLAPAGRARGVVDTAPLFEKRFGQLAGLGWIGKNTLLVNPRFGSWFFLAAVATTEELVYDAPFEENLCGDCRACLDACPTGALTGPGEIDPTRCISYWTIVRHGDVSAEEKAACGGRVYGCDACQEACPHNRSTPTTADTAFYPRETFHRHM